MTGRGSRREAPTIFTTACQARSIKEDVRDELKEGEQIEVKVVNIDPSGKVRLSRKAILKEDEGTKPRYSPEEKAAHRAAAPPDHSSSFGGGGRGGDRGGRPGGGGGRGGPRGPRR